VVVAPTVWSGLSEHHMPFGGTFTLDFATFKSLIECLCRSLLRLGFRRVLLLNGHGGNVAALRVVVDELRTRGDEDGMVKDWTKVPDKRRPRFKEGDIVRIGGGPLEGFFAQVALDTGKALKVWLESFGGQVEAVLDPEGCEAVSPAGGTIAFSRRAASR